MRYALLFLGLLGCTEYGFGGDPNGGDLDENGDAYAWGEADTAGVEEDGSGGGGTRNSTNETTDGDSSDDVTDGITGDDSDESFWDFYDDGDDAGDDDGTGDDDDGAGDDDDVTWDDDGDYVPEVGEGCDEATDMDSIQIDNDGKVFVCHATGSATNPTVLINVSVEGCEEHRVHQGGRDGVPSYGCLP